jgi:hypothetical protein
VEDLAPRGEDFGERDIAIERQREMRGRSRCSKTIKGWDELRRTSAGTKIKEI